ncbi:MAG: hypothetical protein PHT19_09195 [Methylococcus sp.]|nr:hypothetical protein [Methylococcus sp.]
MNEVQEKDHFWYYIAGVVVAVIVTLAMVKNSEHEKYATAAKAIAEDPVNSAYKHDVP